jgi:hypothetical protein
MPPRRKRPIRETLPSLLTSSNPGWDARVLEDTDVVQLLRKAIEQEGSQMAFAKRHGLERTHLNLVLRGRRPPSSSILKLLGLRKVYTAKLRG